MRIFYWRFIRVLLPIIMMFTIHQTVLATPIELSVEDCVALAQKNNPTAKIAEAGRERNYWALKQARSGKGFNLSFIHTDTRYNTPPTTGFFGTDHYTYDDKFNNQLVLGRTLYSGGKIEGQIDAAKFKLKIADLNIDAAKQQLKLDATTAYYDVLQYRDQLQVSEESVDNLEAHLKNVKTQFGAGMVPKTDMLYSEVQLATAQDGLIRARNNYVNAVDNLLTVIGLPLSSETEIKLKDTFKKETYQLTMDECVKYALENRPELAQYLANISVAKAEVKIAKSGHLPSVSLQGTQDWYDESFPGDTNSNWSVTLTTSYNILDAGLTKSQSKQAKASLDAAREQARQTYDSTILEVRQAYTSMREAEKRIETTEEAVEVAEENYRLSEIGYTAGVGSNTNVIDAQSALTQAKILNIQAMHDYTVSRAQLERAMGIKVS